MLQSLDDINIDEDFLNDAFDVPFTNESEKRNSDPLNDQPVKKICTTDNNIRNILSIIKPKSQPSGTSIPNSFIKPAISSPSVNRNSVINRSVNQERSIRVVQRKFPGPAGILPEQKQISIKTLEECDASANNKTLEPVEIVCSQLSDDIFQKGTWQKMLADWSAVINRTSLPNKYTISWTKTKAIAKKLIGQKTPFLAAVIQTIDCSSKDPMILLKDQTGDIQATLLHEVWEEYYDYMNPGSVVVLKQVGVLSTLKKRYLNITLNNIVTIYSEQENEAVVITNIQKISVEELFQIIEKTRQNFQAQKVIQKLQSTTNNPYFKQIPQKSPEILHKPISRQNETTPNKFNFKAKMHENKENKTATADEEIILTQVLDGLDTNSLFEDF